MDAMNTISGGWLGLSFWLSIFLITWLGLVVRGYEVRESFAAGSLFGFIIALLFWSQEWVSDWIMIINIIMVVGSYILLAFKQP